MVSSGRSPSTAQYNIDLFRIILVIINFNQRNKNKSKHIIYFEIKIHLYMHIKVIYKKMASER